MIVKPIKNNEDYDAALTRLDLIFDAPDNTDEGDELEVLACIIDEYENKHFRIEAPDPIEAIKIRMEELNLRQKDLVGLIGGKSLVSEVLNKKKFLNVEMIRKLEDFLQISATILIKKYQLNRI